MNSSPQHISNTDLSTQLRGMTDAERYEVKLTLIREDGSGNVLGRVITNAAHAWIHRLDVGFGAELQPHDHYVSAVDSIDDGDHIYYEVQS